MPTNPLCQVRRTGLLRLRSFGELRGLASAAMARGAREPRRLLASAHWHQGLPPSRQGGQVAVKCEHQDLPFR